MLQIFDARGNPIGYVNPSYIQPNPLAETRQINQRMREEWLQSLANQSRAYCWNWTEISVHVHNGLLQSHLTSEKARAVARDEGELAADPKVRNQFEHLVALRDEVWRLDETLLRQRHHGKYQTLTYMLRRQRDTPAHVADADAYFSFIRSPAGAKRERK